MLRSPRERSVDITRQIRRNPQTPNSDPNHSEAGSHAKDGGYDGGRGAMLSMRTRVYRAAQRNCGSWHMRGFPRQIPRIQGGAHTEIISPKMA